MKLIWSTLRLPLCLLMSVDARRTKKQLESLITQSLVVRHSEVITFFLPACNLGAVVTRSVFDPLVVQLETLIGFKLSVFRMD
jgi:hypothetical protein